MKKMINSTRIAGRLYQHDLVLKVSGEKSKSPGTQFIAGTVDIATNDSCTNIVSVHFSYVTETNKNGKTNDTFTVLKNIINGGYKSVMGHGKGNADLFRIDSSIALNEFYSDRDGKEELVSVKRNEGGFIHHVTNLDEDPEEKRNTFVCDMVINKVTVKEADLDKNLPEKAIISGVIFDFRGAIMPVSFSLLDPQGISYFEGLNASDKDPVFTKVWGNQISETIVNSITEESAFGAPQVREVKSTRKDFLVTGCAPSPYVWDDEDSITAQELIDARAARETYLASMKQRQNEFKASRTVASTPAATVPTNSGFNF